MKPLGRKSFGSIPHLSGSRLGSGDHKIDEGQAKIATLSCRKGDVIIVQEKLDGSNVGVAKINGEIVSLGRAGYLADTSPYRQHQLFAQWVRRNWERFDFLEEGERICGEWLLLAHGTLYNLPHEPFVAFDIIRGTERANYEEFSSRTTDFIIPKLLHVGSPLSIEDMLDRLEPSGHGAIDPVEGAVWRVENNGKVDFLCKYVRPEKVDGCYLESEIWNVDIDEFTKSLL